MIRLARKFYTAVWLRLKTIATYLRRAPSFYLAYRWLQAGLVQTRICDGAAVGLLELPLGKKPSQRVSLDCSADLEMDVFGEVVVGRNYPFEKLPFMPVLVADCGANIGYFSCLARMAFPDAEIFGWEPDDRNFKRLGEQPLLRGSRTTLAKAAVSDKEGVVSLTGAGHGCEIIGGAAQGQGVPCIDFGAWWRQHAVPRSLLKMDIEGHETTVLPTLEGCWIAPCAVFLETHAAGGRDEEIVEQLCEAGFEVELLRSHSLPRDERVFKEYCAILR